MYRGKLYEAMKKKAQDAGEDATRQIESTVQKMLSDSKEASEHAAIDAAIQTFTEYVSGQVYNTVSHELLVLEELEAKAGNIGHEARQALSQKIREAARDAATVAAFCLRRWEEDRY